MPDSQTAFRFLRVEAQPTGLWVILAEDEGGFEVLPEAPARDIKEKLVKLPVTAYELLASGFGKNGKWHGWTLSSISDITRDEKSADRRSTFCIVIYKRKDVAGSLQPKQDTRTTGDNLFLGAGGSTGSNAPQPGVAVGNPRFQGFGNIAGSLSTGQADDKRPSIFDPSKTKSTSFFSQARGTMYSNAPPIKPFFGPESHHESKE